MIGGLLSRRLQDSIGEAVALYYSRLRVLGTLGFFAFPLFYFIWEFFGEKYENLPLRLIGSALCLGLALSDRWPNFLKPYHEAYCFLTAVFSFPFFFTFMAIKNDFSPAWHGSLIACYTILAGFVRSTTLIAIVVLGTFLAFLGILLIDGARELTETFENPLSFSPIIIFALVWGIMFSYHNFDVHLQKVRVLQVQAAQIAHELKRPLTGIALASSALRKSFDAGRDISVDFISELEWESQKALKLFEILKVNASAGENIDAGQFRKCRIGDAIKSAVEGFPYGEDSERDIISVHVEDDFVYRGQDLLTEYLLLNLIKNSLRSIFKKKGGGVLFIKAEAGEHENYLIVKDTGRGINRRSLQRIFNQFYTTGQSTGGQGLGLSFVQKVAASYGGRVSAQSVEGEWAEIKVSFPKTM